MSLPQSPVEVIAARSRPAVDRLKAVIEKIHLGTFPMPVRVWVEDGPHRERAGVPDFYSLVQLLVEVTTKPRPFDYEPDSRAAYKIVFNKGIEHYSLAKMTEQEMAMLVREHIVVALVHEIDEHLLFGGQRLFEPHPKGVGSFEEGPWPEGVWGAHRLSPR